jgi:3-hydroxybutyryl-CoA dehydrogenase
MSRKIERITVIGAGTMGHGIAHISAMAGFDTYLYDVDNAALERGLGFIRANLDKGVEKGFVAANTRESTMEHLSGTTELSVAVEDADLIIEAVPERMALKRAVLGDVCALAPQHAIIGTNTSSLSVTELAKICLNPSQVLGMHFFNPPHRVMLLELVRTESTSQEVLDSVMAVAETMGRELIVVTDSPGFASSRLGLVLGLEAIRMVEQGVASAEDIDKAMVHGYKHPMGPLKLTDWVGLDVRLSIAEYLHRELNAEQFKPPELLKQMVADGKLGRKSGQGFYSW